MPHHYTRLYDSIQYLVPVKQKKELCLSPHGTWYMMECTEYLQYANNSTGKEEEMARIEVPCWGQNCMVWLLCTKLASVFISNILWLQRLALSFVLPLLPPLLSPLNEIAMFWREKPQEEAMLSLIASTVRRRSQSMLWRFSLPSRIKWTVRMCMWVCAL